MEKQNVKKVCIFCKSYPTERSLILNMKFADACLTMTCGGPERGECVMNANGFASCKCKHAMAQFMGSNQECKQPCDFIPCGENEVCKGMAYKIT